jgi:anti-sigma B factor antagonist
MGPQLTILHVAGKPSRLAVSGEIDIYTAPDVHNALCRAADLAVSAGSGSAVTVDLSGVTFIDARGLVTLVVAEAYAYVRGVSMRFSGVTPSITRLLRITNLNLRV